jgi:nucleoside-diphosphate-sugar epimerase
VVGKIATAASVQPGASNAKAKRELGWEPRWPSWREGFRDAPR